MSIAKRRLSIVSPISGTTRDCIDTTLNIGGYPVVMSDTAGLRHATDELEKEGIRIAKEKYASWVTECMK